MHIGGCRRGSGSVIDSVVVGGGSGGTAGAEIGGGSYRSGQDGIAVVRWWLRLLLLLWLFVPQVIYHLYYYRKTLDCEDFRGQKKHNAHVDPSLKYFTIFELVRFNTV